jgi:hypothetical protein
MLQNVMGASYLMKDAPILQARFFKVSQAGFQV